MFNVRRSGKNIYFKISWDSQKKKEMPKKKLTVILCYVRALGSSGVNALVVRWRLIVSWSENCWRLRTQAHGGCVSTPRTTKNRSGFNWAREVPESNDLIKEKKLWIPLKMWTANSSIWKWIGSLCWAPASYFWIKAPVVVTTGPPFLPLSLFPPIQSASINSLRYVGFSLPSGLFNLD